MTTCPSGVNYMHLVDHARAYINDRYKRPWHEWLFRNLLAMVLPHQRRFRIALSLARLARPATPLIDRIAFLTPIAAMLAPAPQKVPHKPSAATSPATEKRGLLTILPRCPEPVLRPHFREATVRVINRRG